jgi:hypothetical protein
MPTRGAATIWRAIVKYLVDKEGMGVFMKLYAAERPEDEMPTLYGASRIELLRRAAL